jgi:hypothetical protein
VRSKPTLEYQVNGTKDIFMKLMMIFFLTAVMAMNAQVAPHKVTSLSKEVARQGWDQIERMMGVTANAAPSVSSTTTALVVESKLNGGYGKEVHFVTSQGGSFYVKGTSCDGNSTVQLRSGYAYGYGEVSSVPVLDTTNFPQTLPGMEDICTIEAYNSVGRGLERVAFVNLRDTTPKSFAVNRESFSLDVFGKPFGYMLFFSEKVPASTKIVLGRRLVSTMASEYFANFPIPQDQSGPITVTFVTPDGNSSTIVYERKLVAICGDPAAVNYGGGLPCMYVIKQQ